MKKQNNFQENLKIYLLHHVNDFEDGLEDIKLFGVFSTKEKARKVLNNHKILPGFRDRIKGFIIAEYILDKSEWNEGFGFMDRND